MIEIISDLVLTMLLKTVKLLTESLNLNIKIQVQTFSTSYNI